MAAHLTQRCAVHPNRYCAQQRRAPSERCYGTYACIVLIERGGGSSGSSGSCVGTEQLRRRPPRVVALSVRTVCVAWLGHGTCRERVIDVVAISVPHGA